MRFFKRLAGAILLFSGLLAVFVLVGGVIGYYTGFNFLGRCLEQMPSLVALFAVGSLVFFVLSFFIIRHEDYHYFDYYYTDKPDGRHVSKTCRFCKQNVWKKRAGEKTELLVRLSSWVGNQKCRKNASERWADRDTIAIIDSMALGVGLYYYSIILVLADGISDGSVLIAGSLTAVIMGAIGMLVINHSTFKELGGWSTMFDYLTSR